MSAFGTKLPNRDIRSSVAIRDKPDMTRTWYWVSETWRAPCLWCPLPASLAGGAGARPDHPISGTGPQGVLNPLRL